MAILLREFSAMEEVNMSLTVMKNNWNERLPYFKKYFSEKNIYRIDDTFSDDQQTIIILENLHRIPLWLKTASRPKRGQAAERSTLENRACRVLEVFPENTPVAEARPAAKDPLRLSAIGDALGSLNFFAIVDTEPIFNTLDPTEAMLLLLATYWVFHLNFGAPNKLPILFLAACVLGPVKVKSYVSKNDKFLDLCRDHFHLEI
ncbi:30S ribosomal protein S17 [Frankliniella fusca]|uniref:30S ribosomal protein S17 n=1 Tax=Frankliniella fusca TaxID=407009 RepID=A0AAE1H5K0_9NEOP|nr:30S ribosomal protein S17 [Frankliniella fusca]